MAAASELAVAADHALMRCLHSLALALCMRTSLSVEPWTIFSGPSNWKVSRQMNFVSSSRSSKIGSRKRLCLFYKTNVQKHIYRDDELMNFLRPRRSLRQLVDFLDWSSMTIASKR